MDYTQKEILHALDVIQTICNNVPCDTCPFYQNGCVINEQAPCEWEIVDPDKQTIWRAFED